MTIRCPFCLFLLSILVGMTQFTAPAMCQSKVNHNFITNLYQAGVKLSSEGANMVISPFSIYTILSMVALGAQGSTLVEIEEALNLEINNHLWLDKIKLLLLDSKASGDVTKTIKNAVLYSKKLCINPEFRDRAAEKFLADFQDADFKNYELTRQTFNQRVSSLTNGLINEALPSGSVDEFSEMIISNILYFKGRWQTPFGKKNTRIDLFHLDQDRSSEVPMMHHNGTFGVTELSNLHAKAILLPYKDERHGLLILLPNDKGGLEEMEKRLLEFNYTPSLMMAIMKDRNVMLALPKFKINFQNEITDILRRVGITKLFSFGADISGIKCTEGESTNQSVKVFHQSTIEVDEEGTEAAASTAVEIGLPISAELNPLPPVEFRADHPFMFYLMDLQNDSNPLFVGRVKNPTIG